MSRRLRHVMLVLLLSTPLPAAADQFKSSHATGMCLGRTSAMTTVLQRCQTAPDLQFSGYGEVRLGDLCLTATAPGQPLRFASCGNTPAQRWALSGRLNNEQGYCADVKGQARQEGTEVIAYRCTGGPNQMWARAPAAAGSASQSGAVQGGLVIDLRQARYQRLAGGAFEIYSADGKVMLGRLENGSFLVAQGGGNLVAQGGGNLVAQGGGNVILPNGTRVPLVAQGGGNLVAQGGGNLVAQGGGNFASGTPLATIVASALSMNPPVAPLSGRALLDAADFASLKTRSVAATAPSPPAVPASRGLVNAQNNRCMDVPGGNFANGIQLVVWDCHGGAGQRFVSDHGFLRVGGKCVAAFDDARRGARVGLWDCVDDQSQKWAIQPDGHIRGPNSYCIGIAGGSTSNGAGLILWDCVNAPNQQWRLGLRGPAGGRHA